MSSSRYSTIALKPDEEKASLDKINRQEFDGKASYAEVVSFLIEEYESDRESVEEFVQIAFSRLDDDDVQRAIARTRNDREWVESLDEDND